MRRLLVVITLACALVPGAVAGAANPDPPLASTGAPRDVTTSAATLTASVTPNASATTVHFDYGTTDSYGLSTVDQPAGAGTTAVTIEAPLSGLTSDTTYHVRVVASNAAGVTRGADRTLRTALVPRAPSAATAGVTAVQPTTMTLTGSLDPRGAASTYHFEYGTSTAYGLSTPDQALPVGARKSVSAQVAGLSPYTRYHYRLVATNAAGSSRGNDHSALTLRAPTAITLEPLQNAPALWSGSVTLRGRLEGQGIAGTTLAVQRSDFPFAAAPWVPKTVKVAGDGSFTVSVGPLWSAVRLQLVSRTTIAVSSAVVEVGNRVLVGVRRSGGDRSSATLAGVVRPAVPAGRVTVQRQAPSGRWVRVARAQLTELAGNRTRYSAHVGRARRAALYRVVVLPQDAGAHLRGVSRELRVRAAR